MAAKRSEEETRREVAYIGWVVLRGAIRDAEMDLAAIGRTIRAGARWMTRRGRREWIALTSDELAELALERNGLAVWIEQLRRERRENARIAGDLIPEQDRERDAGRGAA